MMQETPEKFFEMFHEDFPNPFLAEDQKHELEIGKHLLTDDELEGECLAWCIRFLTDR